MSIKTLLGDDVYNQAKSAKIQIKKAREGALKAPNDPINWMLALFPSIFTRPFGDMHRELYEWAWKVEAGKSSPPFVAIWSRGFGKSTSVEATTLFLGATERRSYCLYVSATQDLADQHLASIRDMAESPIVNSYYPLFAKPKMSKEGHSRGWRRNRLVFGNGFAIDAIGLDTAKRGSKMMDKRPDLFILDDIDEKGDGPAITQKKIDSVFTSLLPAGSKDATILAVQNLIIDTGIFAKLAQPEPPFMKNRILSGPFPALKNFSWSYADNNSKIKLSGELTWKGFTLSELEEVINNVGVTAFQSEYQHLIIDDSSLFANIKFQRIPRNQLPELVFKVVSLDPAVTSSDGSDSHGLSVLGASEDGKFYVLDAWEKRATPELALKKALYFCIKYGADILQIESNQGGDIWFTIWDNVLLEAELTEDERVPGIELVKASAATGGKMERASQMLIDYELNKIFHVEGEHCEVLEAALRRFPIRKPFDLTDSLYWSWQKATDSIRWVI